MQDAERRARDQQSINTSKDRHNVRDALIERDRDRDRERERERGTGREPNIQQAGAETDRK